MFTTCRRFLAASGASLLSFSDGRRVDSQTKKRCGPFEQTYPYKFDIAVSTDSPIKAYADLKGRKMGASEFGGSTCIVTRKALENNGVRPDREIDRGDFIPDKPAQGGTRSLFASVFSTSRAMASRGLNTPWLGVCRRPYRERRQHGLGALDRRGGDRRFPEAASGIP